MGPSGAGKTTLVKLLVGLYRPKSGHIYYNQVPEDEIAIEDLREGIGFVTQDAQLFSGSIRENLRFARPEATAQDCLHLRTQASVQSLLKRADRGLDTVIGEGGVKVSGGEKQRLSIARALLQAAAAAGVRRGDPRRSISLTEEEISSTIRDVAASRGCDHLPDRAPPLDGAARRLPSTCWNAGGLSNSALTGNCWPTRGLYYAMWRQQAGEGAADLAVSPRAYL